MSSHPDRFFRARPWPALAVLASILTLGCGHMPAPLAPVPPVAHAPSELEAATSSVPLPFTDGALLQTLRGDTVRGRESILDYFTAPVGSGHHSIYIATEAVYRCGPEEGVQTGIYQAVLEQEGGFDQIASGRWRAEWVKGAEKWRISEAAFLKPSRGEMPVADRCISMEDERFATARLSFTGHISAVGYTDRNPHHFMDRPEAGAITTPGVFAGARYRLWKGLAVGGYMGSTPTRATKLFHTLHSKTSFRSLVMAYEGRNIIVDVGPAWINTEWWWTNGANNAREPEDAFLSRRGALASLHVTFPVYRQLSVDLLAQQRYFGSDRGLPYLDPEREAAQDHLFLGIGLAIIPGR